MQSQIFLSQCLSKNGYPTMTNHLDLPKSVPLTAMKILFPRNLVTPQDAKKIQIFGNEKLENQYKTRMMIQNIGAGNNTVLNVKCMWHHQPLVVTGFFSNHWYRQPWSLGHKNGPSIISSLKVMLLKHGT